MMDSNSEGAEHVAIKPGRSPFTAIFATGWYDGLTEGLARCGEAGPEYRVDLLDMNHDAETKEDDVRIFALAPLPKGTLGRLEAALAPYHAPKWPLWLQIWTFPSDAERARMDAVVASLLAEAGPPEWVVASSDLNEEIRAARQIASGRLDGVEDWYAFLGLDRAKVEI